MTEVFATILSEVNQNSLVELTAVVLAIAYLILAVRQNIACWYAAFVSTAIFLYVFWQVSLYMEAALQVYYLAMAVYGWWQWRRGSEYGDELKISTWPWQYHIVIWVLITVATIVSGMMLESTNQRLAYVDSFTTWSAVFTTYMVTRKVLENWIYWLVIDSISIYLYLDRELYFTALLFAAYIIIAVFGFYIWYQKYRENGRS